LIASCMAPHPIDDDNSDPDFSKALAPATIF
jgi:hypothetical protein